jgi:hypothetical protein
LQGGDFKAPRFVGAKGRKFEARNPNFVLQISDFRKCPYNFLSADRKGWWKMKLNRIVSISALVLSLFLTACALPRLNNILESEPVNGFEQVGPTTVYNKTNLFDFINGEVVVYFPLGFRLLYTKSYMSQANDALVLVEIYDMGSSEGSLGVYDYYSEREGSIIPGIGDAAWTDKWLILFRRNGYFVRISPDPVPDYPERPADEEMIALARHIDDLLH